MILEIEINRQDYLAFNKHHFIKTRLTTTIITGVLTIIALQWFLNIDGFDLMATVFSSLACSLVFVLLTFLQLRNTKNIPKDDGSILGKRTLQFDDNEINCKAADSTTILKWKHVKSIDNGKSAFYLYLDTNMAILVPKRYFETDMAQKQFVDFVTTKINTA